MSHMERGVIRNNISSPYWTNSTKYGPVQGRPLRPGLCSKHLQCSRVFKPRLFCFQFGDKQIQHTVDCLLANVIDPTGRSESLNCFGVEYPIEACCSPSNSIKEPLVRWFSVTPSQAPALATWRLLSCSAATSAMLFTCLRRVTP